MFQIGTDAKAIPSNKLRSTSTVLFRFGCNTAVTFFLFLLSWILSVGMKRCPKFIRFGKQLRKTKRGQQSPRPLPREF